jgi:hypothetical protein
MPSSLMSPASIEKMLRKGYENLQKFPAPTAIDGPPIFFRKMKLDQKYYRTKNFLKYPIFVTREISGAIFQLSRPLVGAPRPLAPNVENGLRVPVPHTSCRKRKAVSMKATWKIEKIEFRLTPGGSETVGDRPSG